MKTYTVSINHYSSADILTASCAWECPCEVLELFDNEEKAKKYIEKHSIDNKYHKEHYSITETETV
jgi:hypothetical protein